MILCLMITHVLIFEICEDVGTSSARINPHKEIVVLCRQLTFKSNSLLQCSVSCGTGIQVRSVDCTDHHGTSNTQCEPSTKPAAAQPCTTGISCNAGHGSEVSSGQQACIYILFQT